MSKGVQWITPIQYVKYREHQWQRLEKGPRDKEPWTKPDHPITYFNNPKDYGTLCTYDTCFNVKEGYNQRIHRCDALDMGPIHENVFQEEKDKPVPVLTSLIYGRPCRPPLEERETRFNRVTSTKGFNSRNGANMEPDLAQVPY